MKKLSLLCVLFLPLASCAGLAEIREGIAATREKAQELDQTLSQYGPLVESFDERAGEYLDQARGYTQAADQTLADVQSLHDQSLSASTDPESGETDWVTYVLLMLGGGGAAAEAARRRFKGVGQQQDKEREVTVAENAVMHGRIDKRKQAEAALDARLRQLEVQEAVRAAREGSAVVVDDSSAS